MKIFTSRPTPVSDHAFELAFFNEPSLTRFFSVSTSLVATLPVFLFFLFSLENFFLQQQSSFFFFPFFVYTYITFLYERVQASAVQSMGKTHVMHVTLLGSRQVSLQRSHTVPRTTPLTKPVRNYTNGNVKEKICSKVGNLSKHILGTLWEPIFPLSAFEY
uniref:Uncharacterized protein n=1 Tax=Glossina palpalis gambiensis TaxID=67801 RepID=A0A1B0AZV4_9MUSC